MRCASFFFMAQCSYHADGAGPAAAIFRLSLARQRKLVGGADRACSIRACSIAAVRLLRLGSRRRRVLRKARAVWEAQLATTHQRSHPPRPRSELDFASRRAMVAAAEAAYGEALTSAEAVARGRRAMPTRRRRAARPRVAPPGSRRPHGGISAPQRPAGRTSRRCAPRARGRRGRARAHTGRARGVGIRDA